MWPKGVAQKVQHNFKTQCMSNLYLYKKAQLYWLKDKQDSPQENDFKLINISFVSFSFWWRFVSHAAKYCTPSTLSSIYFFLPGLHLFPSVLLLFRLQGSSETRRHWQCGGRSAWHGGRRNVFQDSSWRRCWAGRQAGRRYGRLLKPHRRQDELGDLLSCYYYPNESLLRYTKSTGWTEPPQRLSNFFAWLLFSLPKWFNSEEKFISISWFFFKPHL